MTISTDWLAELRESKRQAIAGAHRGTGQQTNPNVAEEGLQFGQSTLAALIEQTQIETLLEEFCVKILRGHPAFLGYTLGRTVRSRSAGSEVEQTEPDPWSAPVENHHLPRDLNLGNGRYITAVRWELQSNYQSSDGHNVRPLAIIVSATMDGVWLDRQHLAPATAGIFKRALLDTFAAALYTSSRRRGHRHHQSWYRRLWRALFPRSRPSVILAGAAIIVIALSSVLAIHVAQNVGVRP